MKKGIVLGLVSIFVMSFGIVKMRTVEKVDTVEKEVLTYIIPIEDIIGKVEIDETDLFLDAIAFQESSRRYKVVNRFGYMGKYQFSKKTLKNLGYDVSRKEFLNSPVLQEQAMMDLLRHNKMILNNYISYWDGKKIKGKIVTESGILAAAHLAGPKNVKKFFSEGVEFFDGNGTKMSKYLFTFSGYKLNLKDKTPYGTPITLRDKTL